MSIALYEGETGLVGRGHQRFPQLWWQAIPAVIGAAQQMGWIGGGKGKRPRGHAFPGAAELGSAFQKFLLERLDTPVQDTEQFRLGRAALRDATSELARTSRQRLGDAGVAGGFLDSGNLQLSANFDIDRAELQAFGRGVRDLILGLEDRREQGILPFLQGSQELEMASAQAANTVRGQNIDFMTSVLNAATSPGGAEIISTLLEPRAASQYNPNKTGNEGSNEGSGIGNE